jgi:hypothetical protein
MMQILVVVSFKLPPTAFLKRVRKTMKAKESLRIETRFRALLIREETTTGLHGYSDLVR